MKKNRYILVFLFTLLSYFYLKKVKKVLFIQFLLFFLKSMTIDILTDALL